VQLVAPCDRYHAGVEASDFGVQFPISGTKDPELYQTERYALTGQELVYTLPMPVDVHGLFVLTLKFSEVYFERAGQKVFRVALNDHIVIDNLDVFKKVGKNAAYDESVEFRVSNTSKEIVFESAEGSADAAVTVPYDGQLSVRFISAGCDITSLSLLLVCCRDWPTYPPTLAVAVTLKHTLVPAVLLLLPHVCTAGCSSVSTSQATPTLTLPCLPACLPVVIGTITRRSTRCSSRKAALVIDYGYC
jgi:hypothetical protein